MPDGVQSESPLHTVDFLEDFHKILETKFTITTVDKCMDSAGWQQLLILSNLDLFFLLLFYSAVSIVVI